MYLIEKRETVLCIFQNTTQSYEYALQMLTDMKAFGVEPVRRCIAYAAALAIAQNAPQVAIEILTNTRTANYVTIRNLKVSVPGIHCSC